jgi:hypothetical protein
MPDDNRFTTPVQEPIVRNPRFPVPEQIGVGDVLDGDKAAVGEDWSAFCEAEGVHVEQQVPAAHDPEVFGVLGVLLGLDQELAPELEVVLELLGHEVVEWPVRHVSPARRS